MQDFSIKFYREILVLNKFNNLIEIIGLSKING